MMSDRIEKSDADGGAADPEQWVTCHHGTNAVLAR